MLKAGKAIAGIATLVLSYGAASNALALVITPVFDDSLTSAPNADQIEQTIETALAYYNATFSNPVSLSIGFSVSGNLGHRIGESQTAYGFVNTADYLSWLQADAQANPTNKVLSTALANIASGNHASSLLVSTAALNAIGQTAWSGSLSVNPVSFGSGNLDGVVTLNMNAPIAFGGLPSTAQFSGLMVVEHEINEVLGIGGSGSQVGQSISPGAIGPLDLYRYSAPGVASFTTDASTSSYFSIDGGKTSVIGFNQLAGGDYGDFGNSKGNCVKSVQSAFTCRGQIVYMGTKGAALTALESIGYDVYPSVPEPATAELMALGLLGSVIMRRVATSRCAVAI